MPRLRSASASCASVRGASVSSRRHTCRARASGSSLPSAPSLRFPTKAGSDCSAPPAAPERGPLACDLLPGILTSAGGTWQHGGRDGRRHRVVVQARADAELLLDLLLDLVGDVFVLAQEIPRVL